MSLIGPGGMGKTRLALRLAVAEFARFGAPRGGGVWFCDLSEARTRADLVEAVAAPIGARLAGLRDDEESAKAVGSAIARLGRVLVILDNFEHLTAHAASTVGRWLRAASDARFLVTSRVALEIDGEVRWPLSPLSREDAVDLFVRRARDAHAAFDATQDREVIGDIVDRVDRMPLAIELAATRVSVLRPKELFDRLERPLDVLQRGRASGRHSSLRHTILDSVALLPDTARELFVACADFRNGFTLEAAESILGDFVTPRAELLHGLSLLVQSSLVRTLHEPGEDVARFALFETIREVALELSKGDAVRNARLGRHATYYAELATRLGATAAQGREADRAALARDLENVLEAQATAVRLAENDRDSARAGQAAAIATGLEPLLSARGLSRLRVRLFDEALRALDAVVVPPTTTTAEALVGRGFAQRELGASRLARGDFERALSIARAIENPGVAAVALTRLGEMSDLEGDTAHARVQFDEALDLLRQSPDDAGRSLREAEAYLRIGHARRREGALGEAHASLTLSAERYRKFGHDEGLASAIYELAVVEMLRERHREAFAHFDEGLRIAERGGARIVVGALKTARGSMLQDLSRLEEALEHHASAARVFEAAGSRYRETSALYYLATTHVEMGQTATSLALLERALEQSHDVGAHRYVALTTACLAYVHAVLGNEDRAREAIERAEEAGARVRNEAALAANLTIHRMSVTLRFGGLGDASRVFVEAEALVRAAPSDDSRFALRSLSALVRGERGDDDALVVGEGGSFFRPPGAEAPIRLPARSPLRRILELLAQHRVGSPGSAVSLDDLVRAAWPGEKIGATAAQNRVYVAVTTLRKQGLRGILLPLNGGYLLSPSTPVRVGIKGH